MSNWSLAVYRCHQAFRYPLLPRSLAQPARSLRHLPRWIPSRKLRVYSLLDCIPGSKTGFSTDAVAPLDETLETPKSLSLTLRKGPLTKYYVRNPPKRPRKDRRQTYLQARPSRALRFSGVAKHVRGHICDRFKAKVFKVRRSRPENPRLVAANAHKGEHGQDLHREYYEAALRGKLSKTAKRDHWTPQLEFWRRNFWPIFQRVQGNILDPELSQNGRIWTEQLLQNANVNASIIRRRWLNLPPRARADRWPTIMLFCLTHSAESSLLLLQNLTGRPHPPYKMRMDCLLYLKRDRWSEIVADSELLALFRTLISRERAFGRWFRSGCGILPRHLDVHLEEVSLDEGRKMFDEMGTRLGPFYERVLLRFMDFFTAGGDIDLSLKMLRILRTVNPDKFESSRDEVLPRCTNLLKLDSIEEHDSSQNFRILPQLLEIGIRPNVIIHNIVMKNAFQAAVSGVGWDLFRFLQEQGFPTDQRTYLALLMDSFARRDVERVNEIFSAIHQDKDLAHDPFILTYTVDIVRLIYTYQKKATSTEIFSHMLAMYSRAFSAAPLLRLGIVKDSDLISYDLELPEPDSVTLAFMLRSWILVQKGSHTVEQLWFRIQQLLSEGELSTLAMVQHDVLYNGLILFFSRKAGTLPRCLSIVEQMANSRHCEPTSKIWGTLMLAFMKHRQYQAAEKVRLMMVDRGLRPDGEVWKLINQRHPLSELARHAEAELDGLELNPHPPAGGSLRNLATSVPQPNREIQIEGSSLGEMRGHDVEHPKSSLFHVVSWGEEEVTAVPEQSDLGVKGFAAAEAK